VAAGDPAEYLRLPKSEADLPGLDLVTALACASLPYNSARWKI